MAKKEDFPIQGTIPGVLWKANFVPLLLLFILQIFCKSHKTLSHKSETKCHRRLNFLSLSQLLKHLC